MFSLFAIQTGKCASEARFFNYSDKVIELALPIYAFFAAHKWTKIIADKKGMNEKRVEHEKVVSELAAK